MQKSRGVSLLGAIVFLIFVGVLGYVLIPRFLAPSTEEATKKIKTDFNAFYEALDKYRLDNGNYPTTEQGLTALMIEPTSQPVPQFWKQGGYMRDIPQDPWGQPYQYTNNYNVIRVYSFGASGKDGGGTEIDVSTLEGK